MKLSDSYENELQCLAQRVSGHISGKRYSHTLSVEAETARLCTLFGLDPTSSYKLRCAALLHDITKERTLSEQIDICKEFGIPYGDDELKSPKVLHAMTAPAIIKKELPEYADGEILSAIRWHTTGRPDMTLGEKLIYLADYIEPTRDFPDCITLRCEFYSIETPTLEHLDRVLLRSFKMTLDDLRANARPIHPMTLRSAEFLQNELSSK